MTEDVPLFIKLKKQKIGKVSFGDNGHRDILDIGKVGKNSTRFIKNVYLVYDLKHNLLNISQLCDKGNYVWFDNFKCTVKNVITNDIVLHGSRLDNVYAVSLGVRSAALI